MFSANGVRKTVVMLWQIYAIILINDLPVIIKDGNSVENFCYIDDIIEEFKNILNGHTTANQTFYKVNKTYDRTIGSLVSLLNSFKDSRVNLAVPDMSDDFTKKLYSTYLTYLPVDKFRYNLKMNQDSRGSFTEFLKTGNKGQISVNTIKPHIIKGNHWHISKNEKFLVVSGKDVIRLKLIDSNDIIEYYVSGDKLEVVDIPIGYIHNIENIGNGDMITIMWTDESYNPDKLDTYIADIRVNNFI